MDTQGPELPPRKTHTFFSPSFLLQYYETKSSNHRHVFKTRNSDERSLCLHCHLWLISRFEASEEACSYPCHHFHDTSENTYNCCHCGHLAAFETEEPHMPIDILSEIVATRPKAVTFAETAQLKGAVAPTVVSTLDTALLYIKDLLSGQRRNVNTSNPNFISRVGMSSSSQFLMEMIGFTLQDAYFIAPDIEEGSESYVRLQRIEDEILVTLDKLALEVGAAAIPNYTPFRPINLSSLGIVPALESKNGSTDPYLVKTYATLGLTTGASPKLVAWTYEKLQEEGIVGEHELFDALVHICNFNPSCEELQTLVACERSKGKVATSDVGDAYAYFGVSEGNVDDGLLIGLYQVKMSDEPAGKTVHQDKLRTIAIARQSSELLDFLKQEKGISAMDPGNTMAVPAHLINQQITPVGLNNIGNTCYFNSLLQYYFTLVPFRNTMLFNEEFTEGENSEPKKIGGINVDQSEVLRAKKFIQLLKDLFQNLENTHEKTISPEYDLAYMALLNEKEKDDQEEPKTTIQQAQDGVDKNSDEKKDNSEQGANEEGGVSNANNTTVIPDDLPPAYEDIDETITSLDPPQDQPESSTRAAVTKTKERPSVDAMMFGKQQDVTECMGNVMYLVEAALKPLSQTEDGEQIDDMVRQLFYGKARQILSYHDNSTSKMIEKIMEEDFSHVIVDAAQGDNLYDGLDDYFFAGKVENFQGGSEATREVSVKNFPPILQVLIQRVQFDRATANVYKSNAYIQFDKTIYLDRYLDTNFDELKDRRTQVAGWRSELSKYQEQVNKYSKAEHCNMSIPDLLHASFQVLTELEETVPPEKMDEYKASLDLLQRESKEKQQIIDEGLENINIMKSKIKVQYDDYQQLAYRLHAVFIHQGQANYGHYWIYIYDHKNTQWWKYNDSLVTKVQESEIFQDTTGSTANPYFLVYVDANKVDSLVETVAKKPEVISPAAA